MTIRSNNSVAPFNVKLNGKKYNTWLKMLMLHALGEGNRVYLTGNVTKVAEEDLRFDAWCVDNSTIKGWMLK